MKQLIWLSTGLMMSSILFAGDWYGINLPEETYYRISYLSFIAGHGFIKIEKIDFEGREAIRITGRVWSSKFFSLFYKLDDTIVSILDAKTLEPLRHSVDYHEGKYLRKGEFNFDYQNLICSFQKRSIQIKKGILEPLGALIYLRINELKQGIPVRKEIFDGDDIKEVTAVLLGEKRIDTRFGKKDTLVIKPVMKDFRKEGITEVQEKIILYLQKELPRVPYLVEGKVVIGSLKARLIKVNHS